LNHVPTRHIFALAVAALAALLIVAGLASASFLGAPATSRPSPRASARASAVAAASPAAPTPSPSQAVPDLAPRHATPAPTYRLASSYPVVDSCNPASVPGAVPVAVPATATPGAFLLQVPILMYHRIVPIAEAGNSIRGLVVPPEVFAAQMEALAVAGWHTITMAELAADLQAHRKPAPRTFVITIDDGWNDGFTYALPILQSHGYVATYFVIAGRIDSAGNLSTPQIKALVAAGEEIGDHTMDHLSLSRLAPAKLKFEIDAGAARIAQVTGRWPVTLAYPSGGVDNAVAAAVQACGQMRMAVIEAPRAGSGIASPSPRPTALPSASRSPAAVLPAAAAPSLSPLMQPVYETWANRWTIPRLRVTPSTLPANLLAELNRYG
jgi:peptidoglycan/xylan/chitin deacetylase (PgdA/CDA1 family)